MIRIRLILLVVIVVVLAKHFEQPSHPNPDDPTPGPVASEKVLIEYETKPSPPYTPEQFAALQNAKSGDVQAWMATNGVECHALDPDQDISDLDKLWQDAAATAKAKPLPNVSIYNGRRWTVKAQSITDSAGLKKTIGVKP